MFEKIKTQLFGTARRRVAFTAAVVVALLVAAGSQAPVQQAVTTAADKVSTTVVTGVDKVKQVVGLVESEAQAPAPADTPAE